MVALLPNSCLSEHHVSSMDLNLHSCKESPLELITKDEDGQEFTVLSFASLSSNPDNICVWDEINCGSRVTDEHRQARLLQLNEGWQKDLIFAHFRLEEAECVIYRSH